MTIRPLLHDGVQAPAAEPLSPTTKHHLMVGSGPQFRSKGWVAFHTVRPWQREMALADAWALHGAALTREAHAHGFTPWGAAHIIPAGDGVTAWLAEFQKQNEY